MQNIIIRVKRVRGEVSGALLTMNKQGNCRYSKRFPGKYVIFCHYLRPSIPFKSVIFDFDRGIVDFSALSKF